MPSLIVWKERELAKMRREMDRLFERLWADFTVPVMPFSLQPRFEIFEKNDSLVVQARLSGMRPEDIEISVSDDELLVKGTGRSGNFSTRLSLPCRVDPDGVRATFRNDVLHVILPKRKERRIRHIHIQTR